MYLEVRYSSKSFNRHADVTVFNKDGTALQSTSRGDEAVIDEGFCGLVINPHMSGLLTEAQQKTLARMAEVPTDLVVEIMDGGELDARLVDHKRKPLTEEQKKIAIERAEEAINDYDADDLLDAALTGTTDTTEKLRYWYKLAMEEQDEE